MSLVYKMYEMHDRQSGSREHYVLGSRNPTKDQDALS